VNTYKRQVKPNFIRAWIQLIILAPLALMMVGCMKKCQVPTEKQTSVSATEWRMVESTDPDPDIQDNLSKFTFFIFRFGQDFQGDVKAVINNTQYDNPVRTFTFDVDTNSKTLLIKYAFPQGSESSSQGNSEGDKPVAYSYSLGRQLELVGQNGSYYRFVPFTGILSPDDTCSF